MAKDETSEDALDEAREDDGQIYVERDKIDFDPDDGLLSGTALDGTSDIPDADANAEGGQTGDDPSEEPGEDASRDD